MVRVAISQSSDVKRSVANTQQDHAKGPRQNVKPKARCSVHIMTMTARRAHALRSGWRSTTPMLASKSIAERVMKRITGPGM
jgi:hypothetical protein